MPKPHAAAVVDTGDKEERLRQLERRIQGCQNCVLHEGRSHVVAGAGSGAARLFFIGEAPGYHEDRQGIPFVGRAGKLLEQLLARIDLLRNQVYIGNVLKCRPPENRDPLPDEIEHCRSYLEEQISIINPEIICTMGNFATKLLTDNTSGITRVHGAVQKATVAGVTRNIYPVFHPAAALHAPGNMAALETDFDRLPSILDGAGNGAAETSFPASGKDKPGVASGAAEPEQLDLF